MCLFVVVACVQLKATNPAAAVAALTEKRFLEMKKDPKKYDLELVCRSPEDWVSGQWWVFGKASLARGMLLYSDAPIHNSLTPINDDKQKEVALGWFNHLLVWGSGKTASVKEVCLRV
jgi:hypothetical protein